jgi:hypothetical protein
MALLEKNLTIKFRENYKKLSNAKFIRIFYNF